MADLPFDPATTELEGISDPALAPLQATQPATEHEEQVLGQAVIGMMEFLYSEEGLANVVQVLNQDDRELYEKVPDVAMLLLQKSKTDFPDAPPSVFFGDGGLIQQSIELIWPIVEQQGIPGAADEEQISGSIINLYAKVGKYLEDSGDTEAKSQAQDLAIELALTGPDGSQMNPDSMIEQNPLTDAVRAGLGTGGQNV